jgi:hypothetical protein
MLPSNPSEAQAGSAVTDDRATIDIKRSSAYATTVELGSAHACANAFHDQGAFELSHSRDDHNNGAAQRAIRVDRFALGKKLDAKVVQLVEHLKEVLSGSR